MMKRIAFLFVVTLIVLTSPTTAQNPQKERPKVGLVLAGGGAKGAAHIGVIKYLEEIGMPIDYITGTSMGSIIGGMYALGYSAHELDSIITRMDWPQYMSNNIEREYLSMSGRAFKDTYIFSTPFNTGEFNKIFLSSLPSGFILGNSITNLFSCLSVGYGDSIDFNTLPIPFACVATDMLTGDSVVLRSGHLPLAIRASMAIPGIFSPVYRNGKVLVDGGLVNNFPTSLCKEMGADIIIGVDISDEFPTTQEELRSLPQLMVQYSNIAMNGHLEESRALCDVCLHPDILGFSPLSFTTEAIDTLINRGYQVAVKSSAALLKIKEKINSYGEVKPTHIAPKTRMLGDDTVILAMVEYCGIPKKDQIWLSISDNLFDGMKINRSTIDNTVNSILGTEYYTHVTYDVIEAGNEGNYPKYKIRFNLIPSEPHNLSLGLRCDSEESASILLHLGYNQYKPAGWKFSLDWKLNHNPKLEFAASHSNGGNWNTKLSATFHESHFGLGKTYDKNYSNAVIDNYNFDIARINGISHNSVCGLGAEMNVFIVDPNQTQLNFIFKDLNELFTSQGHIAPKLTYKYDSFNDGYFPTKGGMVLGEARWRWSTNGIYNIFAEDGTYWGFGDLTLNLQTALSINSHICLLPQLYNRIVIGEHNELYGNIIGGVQRGRYIDHQMPFIGFNLPQIVEDYLHIARLDCRINFLGNQYLTFMGNYMMCSDQMKHYFSNNDNFHQIWGVGIRYSYKFPMGGPISIDLHWNNMTQKLGVYVNFGCLF